jgi:hypothetical protein
MLNLKQSEKFVSWYKSEYPDREDWLPSIQPEEKDFHVAKRKAFLRTLIKNPDGLYKHRSWGKETRIEKLFSALWLNYWPQVLYY